MSACETQQINRFNILDMSNQNKPYEVLSHSISLRINPTEGNACPFPAPLLRHCTETTRDLFSEAGHLTFLDVVFENQNTTLWLRSRGMQTMSM